MEIGASVSADLEYLIVKVELGDEVEENEYGVVL